MKHLKTILREAQENHQSDEFEFYCDAQRTGEISLNTYFRACIAANATRSEAREWLRENYQRAGIKHLCPV